MRRVITATFLAGVVLLVIAACGGPSPDAGSRDPQDGDPLGIDPQRTQAWALGDGVVTKEEYTAAVKAFRGCITAAGYRVSEPMISPVDGLTLLYDLLPSGDPKVWNKAIEACNLRHISHIEPAYVEGHTQMMAVRLRAATANCLTRQGIALKGGEKNLADFISAAGMRRRQSVMDCVVKAARELFPNLPDELVIRD
jgi:hypothetical protein